MIVRPVQPENDTPSPRDELSRRRRWVCWRYDQGGGKLPLDSRTGKAAKTNDHQTWGTYAQATAAKEEHGHCGVGFVLTTEDPYAVVDLDGVVDPDTGEVEPWAAAMVARFDSYTELSPSGRGLHVWVRGPVGSVKKAGSPPVEILCAGVYSTFTGRHFRGYAIEDRSEQVADLHASITDTSRFEAVCTGIQSPSPALSDNEVLSRARSNRITGPRFTDLYDRGEVPYINPQTGHPDHSRAHFELMWMLAFWTARNAGQMKRLFCASAHGQHPKWVGRRRLHIGRRVGADGPGPQLLLASLVDNVVQPPHGCR